MTFILNILHRDMSILAADRKAIAKCPVIATHNMIVNTVEKPVVQDYKKITLNSIKNLALGIAGHTHEHYYLPEIGLNASIDECLFKIRKHMECFLRVNDRASLNTLGPLTVNQSLVSFFDQGTGTYFSNEFLFSPIHNQTRLHRPADGVKIFHAGSGSEHFQSAVGKECIESFIASTKSSCTLDMCISWAQDAYRKINAVDSDSGADAVFAVSTRSNPKFCFIEHG